jgi:hypothetical protein
LTEDFKAERFATFAGDAVKCIPMAVGTKVSATSTELPMPWQRSLLIIVALALAAMAPLLVLGSPDGHDFEYHLDTWIDAAQQWQAGVWLPRWAYLANYGYGEPRFLFYPPLLRVLGSAALIVLPANAAAGGFAFFVLGVAGVSMFALARRFLPRKHAILAAAFYTVNPYILLCVYQRSAYGELLANALCPLLLLCAVRLPEGNKAVPPLAVVFALFWLSDLPAAVIATYALTLMIVLLGLLHRSFLLWVRGAVAMVLGFGLVAFFILPAAYEQRWVNIVSIISPDFRPENWEYTWTFDAEAQWFYAIISALVYGTGALALVAAVLSFTRRRVWGALWWVCIALSFASIVMMLPDASRLFWIHSPKMEFVQFPWRWLLVLWTCVTFLMAAALARFRAFWLGVVMTALAVVGGYTAGSTATWNPHAITYYQEKISDERGYEGGSEFMPPGSSAEAMHAVRTLPLAQVEGEGSTVQVQHWDPQHRTLSLQCAAPTQLLLHLLNYPGWQVTVNGEPARTSSDKLGRVVVPVPAGPSRVEVRFLRTADQIAGNGISLAAAVLTILLAFATRARGTRAGVAGSGP